MTDASRHVSIWFVIGLQLAIFGALIGAAGLYQLVVPLPDEANGPILQNLHAGIYWGFGLLVLGLFYIIKFRPERKQLS